MTQGQRSKTFGALTFIAICGAAGCTVDTSDELGSGGKNPLASTNSRDTVISPGTRGGILLGSGSECSLGSECSSGYCVDGVCCDTSCTGTCQACTSALKGSGADGACGNIAPNTDPQNECAAVD